MISRVCSFQQDSVVLFPARRGRVVLLLLSAAIYYFVFILKMEWGRDATGDYAIVSLTKASFPGAIKVIKNSFCLDEAVCIGTEIDKNPAAAEELQELCADTALDGVSLVAVHRISNQVAAVAFNKIQVESQDSSEKPFFEVFAEERCKHPSSRALIKYMADIDSKVNLFKKLNVECSLEIMFLATLREHRFKGLAKLLCKYSIEVARKLKEGPVGKMRVEDLGIKYSTMSNRTVTTKVPEICQAIWTGPGTQKIGKYLGFQVYLSMPFTDFEYDGKTYATRIAERRGKEAHCEVAAIVL